MCAAFGSTLGKEKIKMKKEVVKFTDNNTNLLSICIILYEYFGFVVEMLTNCKQNDFFLIFSPFTAPKML